MPFVSRLATDAFTVSNKQLLSRKVIKKGKKNSKYSAPSRVEVGARAREEEQKFEAVVDMSTHHLRSPIDRKNNRQSSSTKMMCTRVDDRFEHDEDDVDSRVSAMPSKR